VSAPPAGTPSVGQRWVDRAPRPGLDFAGTALGIAFFCLSLTPSLLPRPWYVQGIVSGVLSATGYAIGVVLGWTARRLVRWPVYRPGPDARQLAWRILGYGGGALSAVFLYQGSRWQRDIHVLMGQQPPAEFGYLGVPLATVVIFAPLVGLARGLRASARAAGRYLGRWIPAVAARVVGFVAVCALFVAILQGVVANGLMAATNAGWHWLNGQTEGGAAAPSAPELSGSPRSLVSWTSLGRWGREFVSSAPSVEQLRGFAGHPAEQPIRAYVGLQSAPTLRDQAALAVRELERTGAFSRQVLCVITTTGTGLVDVRSLVPLEYMYAGDTAMVALQYSYLPSVISFVADRDRVRAASRELFDQVYARWLAVPAGRRPKLVVFGESLGSFGAESVFSGADDLRDRTDGALFVGPPNASPLWGQFIRDRDPGTGEVLPTYQHGDTVRFAGQPSDLSVPDTPWSPPRVVYLQHASDPVVWWTPRLILHKPDWLADARGRDVLPAMRWYPFVTFWQLTADLMFSTKAPPGHGHDYHGVEGIAAWAQIVPPPGWSPERTGALRVLLSGH